MHKGTLTGAQPACILKESTAPEPTMIATYATAEDFTRWEAKAASMTDAELIYSARDARQAEEAMRGWNPIAEGRYSDEACTYGMELARRRANR
jgi:hypothetical protein